MDDVAAYGYVTPLKVKIVLALALTDAVVRDAEVIMVRLLSRIPLRGLTNDMHTGIYIIDLQGFAHGTLSGRLEPVSKARRRVRRTDPRSAPVSRRWTRKVEDVSEEGGRDWKGFGQSYVVVKRKKEFYYSLPLVVAFTRWFASSTVV